MVYNEKLMNEALRGDKGSLEELMSNAGSGSAEAQYFLAMYYSKSNGGEHDPNYQYWMRKAVGNGYSSAVEEASTFIQEETIEENQTSSFNNSSNHDIWFYLGFEGRVNRSFYIFTTLAYFVFSVSITGLLREMAQNDSPGALSLILSIIGLALWFFWIAQAVKRIHDLNHSGWWLLLPFVPIWLFFAIGDKEENDYGEPM